MTKRLAPTGFSAPDRATATEFWVVRHGESTWNAGGRYQGQTDVPLSAVGLLQAACLAERLTGQAFDAVYSSDLTRARQTAGAVAERLAGAPAVQLSPELREIDVGELTGLVVTEIRERYPEYLTALLASIRTLNAQAYDQLTAPTAAAMQDLAAVEAAWHGRVYGGVAVGADAAYAAALARPFQGRLLREAVPELGAQRMLRIRDAVRSGFATGQTAQQVITGLRGTRAAGYVDGYVELDRRHLETVVHTALQHTAAVAREQFFEANRDLIKAQVWLATLDSRTSPTCIARSGLRYTAGAHPKPLGHAVPWCTPHGCGPGRAHYRCRSTALGLLAGQEALYGQRATGDGPVDANMSYGDWLARQVPHVQDEVLGVRRAQLFRRGGLTLDRFTTERGDWITLDVLRQRDASAFERAGL